MDPNTALLILIVGMLVLLGVSIRASMGLARRAICNVIGRFRERQALGYREAATLEELGLAHTPMFKVLRDYKPYAFQYLNQIEAIQATPDGRFFLDERNLDKVRGVDCIYRQAGA